MTKADKNVDDVLKIPVTIPAHAVKHTGTDYIWELPDSMKAPIKSALLELLLESLPERKFVPKNPLDLPISEFRRNEIFNQALDQTSEAIKRLFE